GIQPGKRQIEVSTILAVCYNEPSSMSNHPIRTNDLTRRGFLKASTTALGAASLASLTQVTQAAESWPPSGRNLVARGDVILFQGDSITDAGRSRDPAKAAAP